MDHSEEFIFSPQGAAGRLDHYLADHIPELTRSQIRRLVDEGNVLLDGARPKAGTRLKGGERIHVRVPPPAPAEPQAEEIPLRVLYEDRHLIVLDKPAGLVVHPAAGHSAGTLVNALLHHCEDLSGVGGELRPGIVHRLDKQTSGVMVASKNDIAHEGLARQFKAHSINRRYMALVHGQVPGARGTIERPIGRHPQDRKKMSTRARQGRRAVTHWQVLRRYESDRLSLVELTLETGRTHQIRVHFAEMNLPLVEDPVYGSPGRGSALRDLELRRRVQLLGRQALHARLLGFEHPVTKEYLEFEAPLPQDMQTIIDYLENKYAAQPQG